MHKPDPIIGRNLKRERRLCGMLQRDLAEHMRAAGMNHWINNTVSRVEGNQQRIDLDEAATLVDILGTDWLVGTRLGDALGLDYYAATEGEV